MNYVQARRLLIEETAAEEGIVFQTRKGALPSSDRMERILAALEVVATALEGKSMVDRELAGSLFSLGFDVQGQLDRTLDERDIREEMLETGIVDMWDQIRAIFFEDEA